jgi:hypothetical protein
MNTLSNSRYYGSHLFKQRLKASELFYKNTMDTNIIKFNNNLREKIKTRATQSVAYPSRIKILQWILTKLGTYLVLRRVWNPIDFQGQRSMSLGQIFTV